MTTGYGLRNVPDLTTAIDEIGRVLTPGGQLLSLDFNRPSNAIVRSAYLAYLTVVGAALGWVLHRDPDTYRYIPASIRQYPGAEGGRAAVRVRAASSRSRLLSGPRRADDHSPCHSRLDDDRTGRAKARSRSSLIDRLRERRPASGPCASRTRRPRDPDADYNFISNEL